MCGSYSYERETQELLKRYAESRLDSNIPEDDREIYYPGQNNLILLPNMKFYMIKWGFTPSFSNRPLINARLETVLEKRTFIEPFCRKRCIIPATSFYEFQAIEGQKNKKKWKISVKDLDIFSMAGICERYQTEDKQSILTYSILTKEAEGEMATIHNRVPVILEKEMENQYLNLEVDPVKLHTELMRLDPVLMFEG